jgi:hypothetical protein
LNRARVASPGYELSSSEYVETLLDAVALLGKAPGRHDRIVVVDQVNPFPFMLGLAPPRGGNLWSGPDAPRRPPERLFADADCVLIPKFSTYGLWTQQALALYRPYLERHFPLRSESESWILLRRGLTNAFDPLEALRESASYLSELRTTFHGNLGLAAAAYNAGPDRVDAWLAGRSALPAETQAYVRIVTGYTAEAWTAKPPPQLEASSAPPGSAPTGARCVALAKLMIENAHRRVDLTASPAWGPWGVQLAGNWSEGGVLAHYERLRRKYPAVLADRLPLVLRARRPDLPTFAVRVSEQSRSAANALCAKLRAAGGACVVFRNPR